jgi:hypothetical protein
MVPLDLDLPEARVRMIEVQNPESAGHHQTLLLNRLK